MSVANSREVSSLAAWQVRYCTIYDAVAKSPSEPYMSTLLGVRIRVYNTWTRFVDIEDCCGAFLETAKIFLQNFNFTHPYTQAQNEFSGRIERLTKIKNQIPFIFNEYQKSTFAPSCIQVGIDFSCAIAEDCLERTIKQLQDLSDNFKSAQDVAFIFHAINQKLNALDRNGNPLSEQEREAEAHQVKAAWSHFRQSAHYSHGGIPEEKLEQLYAWAKQTLSRLYDVTYTYKRPNIGFDDIATFYF